MKKLAEPLTQALAHFFGLCNHCASTKLEELLRKPENKAKAERFLQGKLLTTTYKTRDGSHRAVRFGTLSLKSAAEQHAYQGYLGTNAQ
jgi:hypothetical protein